MSERKKLFLDQIDDFLMEKPKSYDEFKLWKSRIIWFINNDLPKTSKYQNLKDILKKIGTTIIYSVYFEIASKYIRNVLKDLRASVLRDLFPTSSDLFAQNFKDLLKTYSELRKLTNDIPWLSGIVDNLYLAFYIQKMMNLETQNRITLILIDDALELAFKNYILKVKKFNLPEKTKFREDLHKIVRKHGNFSDDYWEIINHYYDLRCDLYHEEGEKTISDSDYKNFHTIVLSIIENLFSLEKINFREKLEL